MYTRDAKLPPEIIPRLREAAKKVNFDFDKDFTATDNTCTEISEGERIMMREKFAGNAIIQTEEQIQAATVRARGNAANSVKAQKMLIEGDVEKAEKAFLELENKAIEFEKEIVKDVVGLENELVKDATLLEKEIVKDVTSIEREIVKDVTTIEKEIVEEVEEVEKDILGIFKKK